MQIVLGHSEDVDTAAALDDVLAELRAGLGHAPPPRAALVFATLSYDHRAVLTALHEAFGLPQIGCTVEAISTSVHGYHEDALVVALLCGEGLVAAAGVARALSRADAPDAPARAAVEQAARALGQPPRVCLSFCESMTVSPLQVLAGLTAGVGPEVPVLGGTSTDDLRFERTFQFCADEVLEDAATCLLLGGDLRAGWCAAGGWYPVGVEGVVTRATGTVVQRIGSETALAFYRRYLGGALLPTGDNPLAIYDGEGDTFRLGAPLRVNEHSGAVTFMGEVPEGARVRITETCRDDILGAAQSAAARAREGCTGAPTAALFFSCGSRKTQLGTRTAIELDMLRRATGPGCAVLGVYTYGEFGSPEPQGPSRYLNQSLVALLLEPA